MKRSVKKISVGPGRARYMVTITGDEIEHGDQEVRIRQDQMLKILADSPDLRNCGPTPFQKLRMFWNGAAWVVEMEAVADDVGV